MQKSTRSALLDLIVHAKIVQDQIEADTTEVLVNGDVLDVIHHFNDLRVANEDVKLIRKQLEILEDRLSHNEIPDMFKRIGIKNLTVEDVGRVSIGHRWGCSIIDKPIGFQYLREQGDGGLIIETVNSSTLAAHAKNLMDTQGKTLPPDKFTTSINPYTSITKA